MTLLILFSHYLLFSKHGIRPVHQKIIGAGLLACAQIILTQLVLGIAGLLYAPLLVFINALIVVIICLYILILNKNETISFKDEGRQWLNGIISICSPLNALLLAMAAFVFVWLSAAVYFLPPRTSDDVVYHLPEIYEYILNHKIFLLPVMMEGHFAFPQNAELTFMWPAILTHSQQWVDGVGLIMACWGVVVIYGLSRAVNITPRTSAFGALLFLFTPVVLAQMGSNYIDLITAVFYIASLYFAVMFYKSSRLIYFYPMVLAGGLYWGMRYDSMIMLLTLIPFVFKRARSVTKRHWVLGFLIFIMAGGYWYFRNFILLSDPFSPMDLTIHGLGIFKARPEGTGGIGAIAMKLLDIGKDSALGSLHGRFGLVFCAIALPAWFYIFIRSIVKKDTLNFWLSLCLIMGVLKLMPVPLNWFNLTLRYSLFIVALALVALGQLLDLFESQEFFIRTIKFSCVIFAVLSVFQLSAVDYPSYQIKKPVNDYVNKHYLTEENYTTSFPKPLVKAWALLDYMTQNDPRGLSCYVAMYKARSAFPTDKTWIAPLYGTYLQNRVWNLEQDKTLPPDAYLYLGPLDDLHYFGVPIPPQSVMADKDYKLVMQTKDPVVLVFVRNEILKDSEKQRRIRKFLGETP